MLWLERLPRTAFLLFLQEIVQYSLSNSIESQI